MKNALTGEKDTSTSPAAGGTGGASAAAGSGKITQVAEDKDQTCKDGTYYGTGTGFGGTVKVKVVIKDNKIKSIEIVEHQDGSSYMQKASALISTVIEKQSTNVDGVSGATYSSAGLIEAIRNAVDQAKMTKTTGDNKKETEKKNNDTSGTVTPQVTGKFPYKDGIYYGTGEGYMGDITVAVVIQNKTVTSILVTETDGDGEEFVKKAKAVADQIVKKQSTRKIDTVSGATYSSKGILEAIKDALNHAKEATNGKETEKPAETETQKPAETEKPSESESSSESEKERVYADGDYTASATCTSSGGGAFDDYTLTATVTIKDDKITAITNVAGSGAGYVAADALYIKRAAEGTRKAQGVVAQVLAKNSLDEIDVVSGATCSSNALLEACRQALESAKIVQQSE
ncbi:MAG: FMN-binding protein [Lachnospiraceae bacterium]